jgi:hypothetical protein
MLAVELNGGLGNQLFQLAAAETIAAETGRTFCIVNATSPTTVHTDRNYFTSVLAEWATSPRLPDPFTTVVEPSFEKRSWDGLPAGNVCLSGYFQNWRYVPRDFGRRLRLPPCEPLSGAFLHIRGGDYVKHWLHDVGLARRYYQRAIERFPAGTHFYVFTNDVPYAKTLRCLDGIAHSFVDADEASSLAQMAACSEGGICANSSFSWWGAYLNPMRTIVMPDTWFTSGSIHTEGYYFPGAQRCAV